MFEEDCNIHYLTKKLVFESYLCISENTLSKIFQVTIDIDSSYE